MFNVGVIGAGRLARTHIRHLKNVVDLQVTVYDSNSAAADAMATEAGGKSVNSVDDLLAASDAVMIVTPNFAHADYAVRAIKADKHVFVEKPLSVSIATAEPILEAASKSKKTVLVGHVLRHFSVFKLAHEHVKQGGIGVPSAIRMTRGGKMPGGADSWFSDHTRSGGAFIDLGVHDFDWLLWTLGEPTQVYAKSVGAKTKFGPDYGLATVSFKNGAVAHVESTWMDEHDPFVAFEVCGSGGMIEYDSRRSNTLRSGVWGAQNVLPDDDPFFRQMKNFYEACTGQAKAHVSVQEAFDALRLAESAVLSAESGKPLVY